MAGGCPLLPRCDSKGRGGRQRRRSVDRHCGLRRLPLRQTGVNHLLDDDGTTVLARRLGQLGGHGDPNVPALRRGHRCPAGRAGRGSTKADFDAGCRLQPRRPSPVRRESVVASSCSTRTPCRDRPDPQPSTRRCPKMALDPDRSDAYIAWRGDNPSRGAGLPRPHRHVGHGGVTRHPNRRPPHGDVARAAPASSSDLNGWSTAAWQR